MIVADTPDGSSPVDAFLAQAPEVVDESLDDASLEREREADQTEENIEAARRHLMNVRHDLIGEFVTRPEDPEDHQRLSDLL